MLVLGTKVCLVAFLGTVTTVRCIPCGLGLVSLAGLNCVLGVGDLVGPLELDSVAVARWDVSDARYEAGTVCSFCELGAISGREHEWWLCPAHLNDGLARPPQAAADLLCWPICSEYELSRVRIQHVVSVRKARLRNRYD
eukprot:s2898_g1.t1